MKFQKVILNNFMSYQSLKLNIQDGMWLIVGKNGAGKSTIFDAITFALYGKTRGDINSVINDNANSCKVQLLFILHRLYYTIIRERERDGIMKLTIIQMDGSKTKKDLSEQTTIDTQAKLNNIIGLDYDAFVSSIYFEQNNIDAFMSKNASQRKTLFFDMLGLGIYARAESVAKGKKNELESELSESYARIEMLEKYIKDGQDYIDKHNTNNDLLPEYEEKIKTQKDRIKVIEDNLTKKKSIVDNYDLLQKYVKDEEIMSLEYVECKQNIEEIDITLNKAQAKLNNFDASEIVKLRKQINNGQKCDKCGSIINSKEIKQAKEKLDKGEREYQTLKDLISGLNLNKNQYISKRDELKKRIIELKSDLKKYDTNFNYTGAKNDLAKLSTILSENENKLEDMMSEYTKLKADRLSIDKTINDIVKEKTKLKELTSKLINIKKEIEIYKKLTNAFSRDGIPSYILENALPDIEQKTNEMLTKFMNESVYVHFRVQKETKSGKIKDTFDIVINENGKVKDYNTYSGGEKVRINIAIRLAISAMLMNRAGINIKMLMIDEVEYLDDEGLEQFVQIMQSLTEQFDTIFIISHINKLKDMFTNVLKIDKTYEGSEIKEIK